ncbi:SDR family oxidoreductase [Pseudofrankia sp. BMG5.36]|uniref:SDR family oxidoreductase n=1 Tax=Pseudofrankia sp. BMG5.36 TaxID=1834512 RepID=UPI0008DA0CB9|nr:SDR family oxidoreductase [Pseudofrankia sp. BMG5.36]OHV48405.1 short-chain dehydrogenase [Pseudofrankia sp. BMG5.36]
MDVAGKVAVVTGSGNGIGEAIAKRLAAEGASVVVTDIERDNVTRVANEIGTVGLEADVTKEDEVKAVARLARETYGRIDIWHSNAGLAGPRQPDSLQDDDLWNGMWRLHVLAHLYAAREVLPEMVARGDGYLLQTASSVALATQPEKVGYAVTKHAALAFSEWLAVRYRPRGVKVSCFCPGPMLTRMLLSNGFAADDPAISGALTPEQVADLVVRALADERFLILTQPDDVRALVGKGTDYDAWVDDYSRLLSTSSVGAAGAADAQESRPSSTA